MEEILGKEEETKAQKAPYCSHMCPWNPCQIAHLHQKISCLISPSIVFEHQQLARSMNAVASNKLHLSRPSLDQQLYECQIFQWTWRVKQLNFKFYIDELREWFSENGKLTSFTCNQLVRIGNGNRWQVMRCGVTHICQEANDKIGGAMKNGELKNWR